MPLSTTLWLLIAAAAAVLGSPTGMNCNSYLNLEFLDTQGGNVTCADGSPAAYYYQTPPYPGPYSKFVIWFGDGAMCGNVQDCTDSYLLKSYSDADLCKEDQFTYYPDDDMGRGRCYTDKLPHTSNWYQTNYSMIQANNVLCGDDAHFYDYVRVYVPSCTLDWFMGDGDDDPSATHQLWRGSRVMDSVLLDLKIKYALDTASRVVLMGGGGGGIGVLNNLKRIKAELPQVPNLLAVVDSSFLINFERFANLSRVNMGPGEVAFKLDKELRTNTGSWIASATTDPDCLAYWKGSESVRCFYLSEVVRRLGNHRVMVIQSQYDMGMMSQLDLFNDSLYEIYVDNASYAQNVAGYIESFGSGMRRLIDSTAAVQAAGDNVYVYSTSCGQYGYLVPTQHHYIEDRLIDFGRAGKLSLGRESQTWDTISVFDLTLRASLVGWLDVEGVKKPIAAQSLLSQTDRNGVRGDKCLSFLCNPTCNTQVIPFQLGSVWGPCSQKLIVSYCLIVIGVFFFIFFVALIAVCMFRHTTDRYWQRVIEDEQEAMLEDPDSEIKFRAMAEEELVRDAFASARRVHLMVRDLSYFAPPRGRGKPYQIIRNVSLAFGAGKVHAMMGPSGSGKSTLLDIIALIRDSGTISGMHFVNGVDSFSPQASFLREWLRHNVSYVKQQDNMFPLLTVREHLTHAAWLMLPEFMDTDAKLRRVWQVIKLLGLEKAADTICGDGGVEVEGGISGGQRRRVSVATQLLRLPACLLLDEPTSGLDATNALSLVKSLYTFAHQGGANIIMTIHQPRKEIFRFLDTLTILVGGRVLFSGAPREAFDHFGISRKLNIGDEVLDQLGKAQLEAVQSFQSKYEQGILGKRMEAEMLKEIVLDFDHHLAAQLEYTLTTSALADGRWSWTESSSAPLLMYVLLSRTFKRGGFDLLKTLAISLGGGILVGLVFLGSKDTYARHVSMAYLSVAAMTFLQGTFIGDRYWAEKFMYTFESEAGTARPWLSFLVSLFCRIIVSSTCEALAFAVPVFFLSKMHNEADQVRMFLLLVTMCSVTVATQYLMVEIYFMKPDDKRTGALVNIALLAMSAIFNGFIIQLKDLPVYLQWIPYIMLSYWSFVGILVNDLSGFTLPCDASVLECSARSGDAMVKSLKYDDRDLYQCLFALLIMTGAFQLLGILFFFFRWVSPIGSGLKRVGSKETSLDYEQFYLKAKDLVANGVKNTMKNVLEDGSKLKRADGKLGRNGSNPELVRNNSDLSRSGSNPDLTRTPSDLDSSSRALFNPPPSPSPAMYSDSDYAKTLSTEDSTTNVNQQQDGEEQYDDFVVKKSCCRDDSWVVRPWLSRIGLAMFFVLDFLASAVICNGQEGLDIGGGLQLDLNFSTVEIASVATGGNRLFLAISAVFFVGYLLQFVVQFFLYFPGCYPGRIFFLDVAGLVLTAADVLVIIVLASQPPGASSQLYFLIAIRAIRLCRVMSFWFKVSALHELRVIAYLEYKLMIVEDYDAGALGDNVGNDLGENQLDTKPLVPPKMSKPQIDPKLIMGLDVKLRDEQRANNPRATRRESQKPTTFMGRTAQSIRFAADAIVAPPAGGMENTRKSLQRRISDANHKRVSNRLGPGLTSAAAPPAVPPRRGEPPAQGRGTVTARGVGAAGDRTSRLPGAMMVAPPPVPARTNLPASMRVAPPGSQPPASASSMSRRISMAANRGLSAAIPSAGGGVSHNSRGPPPPIPSRTAHSVAGFGVSPGAMKVMQGQKPSAMRRHGPLPDEI
ncbi:hypothetical protein BASA81_001404 [Batrachochytrium salamandrivorans]|nr:hypothetical protein BASA81_001404 [Batrachochytrium salamandrivorans]